MAIAYAIVKMSSSSGEMVIDHLLPFSSESAAQIAGPDTKPRTYRVVPRDMTSVLRLRSDSSVE